MRRSTNLALAAGSISIRRWCVSSLIRAAATPSTSFKQGLVSDGRHDPVGRPRLIEALDRLVQLYTVTNKSDGVKKRRTERAKRPIAFFAEILYSTSDVVSNDVGRRDRSAPAAERHENVLSACLALSERSEKISLDSDGLDTAQRGEALKCEKPAENAGFSQENADKVSETKTLEQPCAGGFPSRPGRFKKPARQSGD
jgi:hypothetical protein